MVLFRHPQLFVRPSANLDIFARQVLPHLHSQRATVCPQRFFSNERTVRFLISDPIVMRSVAVFTTGTLKLAFTLLTKVMNCSGLIVPRCRRCRAASIFRMRAACCLSERCDS